MSTRPGITALGRASSLQGVRYLIVGAWNTLSGYALFAALQLTIGRWVHYLIIVVVSMIISVLQAFVLYRRFVFRTTGPWLGELGRFSLVYSGALAVNLALLPILVDVAGIPVLAAQAMVVFTTVLMSFFAHRTFTFGRSPKAPR